MEGILLLPPRAAGAPPPPVVLVPHGGPHVASSAGYFPSLAFLAAGGFAVLQANYRGSTGFGQAALSSLLGRAGAQDVGDCVAILDAAAAAGLVDGARASYAGGSHGGFLGGHLAGQFPGKFKSFCLRNPVTNISSMVGVTDIPDWRAPGHGRPANHSQSKRIQAPSFRAITRSAAGRSAAELARAPVCRRCFVETPGLGVKAFAEPPSAEQLAAMQASRLGGPAGSSMCEAQ